MDKRARNAFLNYQDCESLVVYHLLRFLDQLPQQLDKLRIFHLSHGTCLIDWLCPPAYGSAPSWKACRTPWRPQRRALVERGYVKAP